ncbi:hypothetical protein Cob_v008255 [Colletotrichum orbiculare MAFF 240422]|uniref:Uncharacterized protein n=1 Tax=Colletotrichum orbiculare (strain 104-T / ATCC 96160 / CBS 514.97 / LARS 414 / MAFF 240422) TaxID=1213857 RepID=A0A484FM50_COLOR|nr:hypothetical protein Cob_v008255 [Colletotrichum orbiculare MAFF 240422]
MTAQPRYVTYHSTQFLANITTRFWVQVKGAGGRLVRCCNQAPPCSPDLLWLPFVGATKDSEEPSSYHHKYNNKLSLNPRVLTPHPNPTTTATFSQRPKDALLLLQAHWRPQLRHQRPRRPPRRPSRTLALPHRSLQLLQIAIPQ